MKKLFRHIVCLALVALVLCSCKGVRVIPRGTMTDIYADMAMADALLSQDYHSRRIADTSRVYAAILQKYGYTEEDFRASEQEYIKDAGRYVRIVKKAVLKLDAEKKVLKEEKRRADDLRDRAAAVRRFAPHRIYLLDTLDIADSLLFDFDFQEGLDTAYRGPMMIVWADTVGLAQRQKDSLAVQDTLRGASREVFQGVSRGALHGGNAARNVQIGKGAVQETKPEDRERQDSERHRKIDNVVKTKAVGTKADVKIQ